MTPEAEFWRNGEGVQGGEVFLCTKAREVGLREGHPLNQETCLAQGLLFDLNDQDALVRVKVIDRKIKALKVLRREA
jgi:hypothetical protein